ncbi:phosphonate C-P lyase system protein PhnH [Neobacillus massiliamazoniensis]|uniref:Phosphonate C-P lyase system protein PhnH n=1 Tax=Neobacillus massiliamazoniensis TaxID=1499688 RepID=A0A0U1NW42_9BACI|nr:phosphonate C-P lyase system protein PhnH [Neobacillus massiliamazoniensis]CRK82205.1 phosphonate C-P lyase system protein PhnH [Neobacillus massiliamazoniensis]
MQIDLVHDIQTAYRKVIDSMSRPGVISDLHEVTAKADFHIGCNPLIEVLALMLLDTEVTFNVVSVREEKITRLINQLTYAKAADTDKADFIFVLKDCDQKGLEAAIRSAKLGSLINPHESATFIIETESVSTGTELFLTGPGIEAEHALGIAAAETWLDIRNEKNKEYPLGIDIILTDANDSILCLPRTTQIRKRVTD